MEFRIADTFTTSLARLTGDEQKAAKTTAFDLQMDPIGNGMSFHKLDRAKDPNFWSVRVSRDIRLIVHKTAGSLLLCYVDHHDKAYQWAERRKLEVHPTTGAAQLVEVRERVEEILVPKYVEDSRPATQQKPKLFAKYGDVQLLAYGVPQEWLADVKAADEDSLLELADHLPGEAAEALLELATGGARPCRKWQPRGQTHSSTQTRNAASASCPIWTNWPAPWNTHGTSGRCSCIRHNGNWSSVITTVRRVCLARPARARPWLPCTGLCIWRIRAKTRAFCFPRFRTRWPTPYAAICIG